MLSNPRSGRTGLCSRFLTDAYDEETLEGGEARIVLRLHPALAPYKLAILPLQKKLSEKADGIFKALSKKIYGYL